MMCQWCVMPNSACGNCTGWIPGVLKNNLVETLRNRFQGTKLNDRPVCLHSQNTKHIKAHPLKQRLHRFRVSVGAISSYCATRAAKVGNGGNQYPFQSNTEMKSGPKTSNPHNTPGESTAQPKKYQTTLHTATRAGEAWHCLSCALHKVLPQLQSRSAYQTQSKIQTNKGCWTSPVMILDSSDYGLVASQSFRLYRALEKPYSMMASSVVLGVAGADQGAFSSVPVGCFVTLVTGSLDSLSWSGSGFPHLMATGFSLMPKTHASSHGAGQVVPVNSGKLLVSSNRSKALFHSPWQFPGNHGSFQVWNTAWTRLSCICPKCILSAMPVPINTHLGMAQNDWPPSCSSSRLMHQLIPGGDAVAQGAASTTLVRTMAWAIQWIQWTFSIRKTEVELGDLTALMWPWRLYRKNNPLFSSDATLIQEKLPSQSHAGYLA